MNSLREAIDDWWMSCLIFPDRLKIVKRLTTEDIANIFEKKKPLFKTLRDQFDLEIRQ